MYRIKKVLNTSVVLVMNNKSEEFIITGKGIGFNKKRNDKIELNNNEYQFFIPANNNAQLYIDLINMISPEVFTITEEVIEIAKKELGTHLNNSIYFLLADHINFALERYKENVRVTNKLVWEMKSFYPDEYQAGLKCLQHINEKLNIELFDEEAVNIAFHLVNAGTNYESKDSAKTAKLIGEIMHLVLFSLNKPISETSIHYSRFITHMRFFADRFFSDCLLDDNNGLYETVHSQLQEDEEIALKVKKYLDVKYKKVIPNEEVAFLTIHISRLNRYN